MALPYLVPPDNSEDLLALAELLDNVMAVPIDDIQTVCEVDALVDSVKCETCGEFLLDGAVADGLHPPVFRHEHDPTLKFWFAIASLERGETTLLGAIRTMEGW